MKKIIEWNKSIIIKAMALFLIVTMIFQCFVPIMKVFAFSGNVEDYAKIAMRQATNISISDNGASIQYENGIIEVEGNNLQFDIDENFNYGNHTGRMCYLYTSDDNVTFKITPNEGYTVYRFENGQSNKVENNTYQMTGLTKGQNFNIEFTFDNSQGGNNNQQSNIDIQFDGDVTENVVTYHVNDKDVTLTVNGTNISDGKINIDRKDLGTVSFSLSDNYDDQTMQVIVRGADNYQQTLNVNNKSISLDGLNLPNGGLHLSIEAKPSGGNDNNNPPINYPDNISFSVKFENTTGAIQINGRNAGEEGSSWSGTVEGAGYGDSQKTNIIKIMTSFGFTKASKANINGKDYVFTDTSDFHDITVPGASSYTIVVYGDENLAKDTTIIWANVDANQNADDFDEDMILKHGSAKIKAIYDENGQQIEGEITAGDNGMAMVPVVAGSKVVFEFVTEYGYQLTSVKANGFDLEPQDTTNEYTFTMPNTNVHFAAEFKETKDIVKANSEKITSGTIDLGNTLPGGSAQLTVNDVQLSSDKIAGFENAAGEYTISDYLNIDLYNVYYKGKDDDQDVWSNKIDELENEATITIQLEDGVNADDIVIVHNIHDGDQYEIIEIDSYDPITNTITFKTKSFSNYAIATKTSKKVDKNEINTGDQTLVGLYSSLCAVSLFLLFALVIRKKLTE